MTHTVLQFSGGKDSLACLYLFEPQWEELAVAWVNTGAAFPEVLELMDQVRARVPDFREIRTSQTIERAGYPVDLLPIGATPVGAYLEGRRGGAHFQSRNACCAASIWIPMHQAMKDWGVKVVIRGQKRCDRRRSTIADGEVLDGIEYRFPLEDWSDEDVCRYLRECDVALPRNYLEGMRTGLDCWNCTAYLDDQGGRFEYMRAHHPEKFEHVRAVLRDYRAALTRELSPIVRTIQWA